MGCKKKNRLPPFVAILKEMLRSEAWGSISNAARVAFLHLKAKSVSFHDDEITLSYQEMERIMERRTFAKALRELETYGFITITQKGGLYRRRNYFRFSDQWKNIKGRKGHALNSSGILHTVDSGNNATVTAS